jgi:BRCA1 C Terminus (BRCT) domain/WGR domain
VTPDLPLLMPPKASKRVTAPPLAGCSIALSGKFPRSQSAIEQDFIIALGASLAKTVNASTTHLITTDTDYEKSPVKVKQAKSHDVKIVKLQWLEDCLDQRKKLSEDDYGFDPVPTAPTANGKINGSRKRGASDDNVVADDDTQAQPNKKKTRPTNGSTLQLQQEPTAKSEPKENVSDGQTNVAKSREVQIPVDEHCPLTHYKVYIDDEDVIYDAALNQTNSSDNNNKFYRVQVCDKTHPLLLADIPKESPSFSTMVAIIRLGLAGVGSETVDSAKPSVLVVSKMPSSNSTRSSRTRAAWLGKSEATNRNRVNIPSSRELTVKIQRMREMMP